MPTNVHTRMVTRLKAVSAVTDIVGASTAARIRPMQRNQGGALPAVLYAQVGGYRSNVADGTSTTGSTRFRLHCVASSYDGAHTLSDAVEGALSGWDDTTDAASGIWHLDMGPMDGPDEPMPGQDAAEYAVIQDYVVWHSTT